MLPCITGFSVDPWRPLSKGEATRRLLLVPASVGVHMEPRNLRTALATAGHADARLRGQPFDAVRVTEQGQWKPVGGGSATLSASYLVPA